ncbi:MAG: c-type cytochrome, partial [Verrucomicrobia bacterium]|nr:c-type cytochrome [Verrucomicrobiota bacterium]
VTVEELPPTPEGKIFRPAPAPPKGAAVEPVSPEAQKARFTLSPGFEIELVASEDSEAGIGKFVAVDWDQQGRLWTMTALEYPVDANESPDQARELYSSKAKDKVLVFDRDSTSPTGYSRKPRVFADGLAIPLGILPYRNGAYVQHGTEIVFLTDSDGDGRADNRETILGGFGVQDSHLFPHQFTRGPGDWIWFAQGAFNYGKVRTRRGQEIQFDQTRMARFRYDGSEFDITSQGPCNIWGLFITKEGVTWIQEANDFGYPAMVFHEHANYPGCSQAQWKSYAPEFPPTAPHFAVGGTGLSGLAISDVGYWPEGYANRIFVANPITRKIQAIGIDGAGPRPPISLLGDFVLSSDEMFRPVALRLGPDGCLYIVDWYNKIISHNEVARNHPERDKKRGRIWRVKHRGTPALEVPNFERLPAEQLVSLLGAPNTTQSHLAWQAIGDRKLNSLAPQLGAIVRDNAQPAGRRIAALWAMEALGAERLDALRSLVKASHPDLRRESLRAMAEVKAPIQHLAPHLATALTDSDASVRAEAGRSAGRLLLRDTTERDGLDEPHPSIAILVALARPSLEGPTAKSTQHGRVIKVGEAYEREFERYLARLFLEQRPNHVAAFLDSPAGSVMPVENRIVAALSLEGARSALMVGSLLKGLKRRPNPEEVLGLARHSAEPGVARALKELLQDPQQGAGIAETLLNVRTQFDPARIRPAVTQAAQELWALPERRALALGLISGFKLSDFEGVLDETLSTSQPIPSQTEVLAVLRAMRDLGVHRIGGLLKQFRSPDRAIADEAVLALASSRNPEAGEKLCGILWRDLSAVQRRGALAGLSSSKHGAQAIIRGASDSTIGKDELDPILLEKLQAVLGQDPGLLDIMNRMDGYFRTALRLDGTEDAWVADTFTLTGAFTVEAWVKLDSGIGNQDGILGSPGELDMNFFDSAFRVWVGGATHDAIISPRKIQPDVWTHVAAVRDASGRFKLYGNGELEPAESEVVTKPFTDLRIGWTGTKGGTKGWLTEFRAWNVERKAEEIRANFDRSFEGEALPAALVAYRSGAGSWKGAQAGAKPLKTADFPPLMTAAEARESEARFNRYRALAAREGDAKAGRKIFESTCMSCHAVQGQGGQIGPVLNGAGASGMESLLRNILTPGAAMEPGYRLYRVELADGDLVDGLRVSEDQEAVVLRRANTSDLRIPQSQVRRAAFTKMSMMPDGLLDALPPEDVPHLFAYLLTLR